VTVAAPEYVIVGRVRRAHGIRGEVVVEALTDDPERLLAVGARLLAGTVEGLVETGAGGEPRELTIRRSTPFKGGRILRFQEIPDRTAAELWRERYLLVPRTDVAPPAQDEVYLHDLVGLQVESTGGVDLGRVEGLYEVPQGVLVEVRTPRGSLVLVPYQPPMIARTDLARGTIVVDPPPGLFEEPH